MFKQIKSAIFWYYLYKFRRRALLISFLLIVALFANSIYADIVQYLTLKNKLQYLEMALVLKWAIIICNLLFSIYLILSIFQKKEQISQEQEIKPKKEENKKFSKREEMFLNKQNLKNQADKLVER
jgi:hypothetical protein